MLSNFEQSVDSAVPPGSSRQQRASARPLAGGQKQRPRQLLVGFLMGGLEEGRPQNCRPEPQLRPCPAWVRPLGAQGQMLNFLLHRPVITVVPGTTKDFQSDGSHVDPVRGPQSVQILLESSESVGRVPTPADIVRWVGGWLLEPQPRPPGARQVVAARRAEIYNNEACGEESNWVPAWPLISSAGPRFIADLVAIEPRAWDQVQRAFGQQ